MTPRALARTLVLGVLALGLAACGDDEAPPASAGGRGPLSAGRGAVASPAVSAGPPVAPAGTTRTGRTGSSRASSGGTSGRLGAGPGTPVVAPSGATDEGDEEPAREERDLGEELHAAIGSIERCIDLETARTLEGTLHVNVTAQIMPSGRISTASANAARLSRAQNACIEDIVEHVSLPGPIDGAPRSISTSIELVVEITEPEEPAAE